MKRIAYARWERHILVAFGSQTASADEWSGYVKFIRPLTTDHRQRGLIVSQGATLEFSQREELTRLLGPHRSHDRRIALVSASTFVRGFVKALSMLDPTYRGFAPAELDAALTYVEVPQVSRGEVRDILARLQVEVS